jgi:hypothetical protein
MKYYLLILFFSGITISFAQQNFSLHEIDYRVQSIEPTPAKGLAYKLTSPYPNQIQKVRAIFSWVAEHIEYNVHKSSIRNSSPGKLTLLKPVDSISNNSADEYVAEKVLRNRSGVCEGYARLFKTLCDYAGIQSALITGYARSNINHVGLKFLSNHYWNAVFIDSAWHLLDVTWASGYISLYDNKFINQFDDYYFFTAPELFIRDHFPDDLQWTLLTDPKAPDEFSNSPFKQKDFLKYNIVSFSPQAGFINASVGDTIKFELKTSDAQADKLKAADTASLDSNMLLKYPSVVFLQPVIAGNIIKYEYPVMSAGVTWLHIMYNNDIILCYKLKIKNKQ